jgi:Holliday junction resolvase RusA-like endonuclease
MSGRLLFSLELLGPPRGKGRPRFRVLGKGKRQFVSTYTDTETRKYEDRLRTAAMAKIGMSEPLSTPLYVKIDALMPIPESWSARKKAQAEAGEIMPVSKPDADNLLKIALDPLNKVVWTDDSIIVGLSMVKRYSANPLLRISVWDWFD